jgi:hypothetical protein
MAQQQQNYNDDDFLKYLQGAGVSFQPYAAGNKRYGPSMNSAPNVGPVADKQGYRERDLKMKAMRNAMLRRMQAGQRQRFMSSDYLDPMGRSF